MKTIFAALALFLFAPLAFSQEAVTTEAKPCQQWCKPYWKSMPKEEYVYFGAAALDMFTTLDIKHHPNLEESNFVLGKHPSDAKIVGWFVLTDLLHSAITYELVDNDVPRPIVKTWEYLTIGVELGYAVHNYRLGLRFSF